SGLARDRIEDRCLAETGTTERFEQAGSLEGAIGLGLEMLQAAAAAQAEMAAGGIDALGRRREHRLEPGLPAFAAPADQAGAHALAGERARDIGRDAIEITDAVAASAEAPDRELDRLGGERRGGFASCVCCQAFRHRPRAMS